VPNNTESLFDKLNVHALRSYLQRYEKTDFLSYRIAIIDGCRFSVDKNGF
jgi:hypothetical protein